MVSVWYMLLDPKFSFLAGPNRRVGGSMGNAAGRRSGSVVRAIKSWWNRQQAINELQLLDDRLLADIGIRRSEIPEVVKGMQAADNVYPLGSTSAKHDRKNVEEGALAA